VHVLPELHEADREAGVLAVRDPLRGGQLGVLLEDLQDLPARRGTFGGERTVEGAQHLAAEVPVGLHAELLDRIRDRRDVDLAHGRLRPSAWPWRRGIPSDPSPSPTAWDRACGWRAPTGDRTGPRPSRIDRPRTCRRGA